MIYLDKLALFGLGIAFVMFFMEWLNCRKWLKENRERLKKLKSSEEEKRK